MIKNIFEKLNKSSTSCIFYPIKTEKKILISLNKICEKILGKKFNLQNEKDLNLLSQKELEIIFEKFSNKYQKNLKLIFWPIIKNYLSNIFIKKDLVKFRVGIQAKYKWPKSHSKLRNKLKIYKNGTWRENKIFPNICYPTRMHQDLSNNGFRGSCILIFYFQTSKISNKTSNLNFYKFKNKIGILPYSNKYNYGNEIIQKNLKKKSIRPKKLSYKYLCIMDTYAAHSSSLVSKLPRIAFNIKIQPSNYKLILKNFDEIIKKNKGLNYKKKIENLYNEFNTISKKNNRFNFEAATLAKMLGDNRKCRMHLKSLYKFKPTKKNYEDFIIGAFLKKTAVMIKNKDRKIINKKLPIVKFSCADNLLNTINVKMSYLDA